MDRNIEKTFRFRKFKVYVDARCFIIELKRFMRECLPNDERFELRSQLWRALDSILLNIAEGSDRGTDKDFAKFLNQAHTSLNEVVACMDISLDNSYIDCMHHELWLARYAELVGQLTAFRQTLLNSESKVKGQRSKVLYGFTLVEIIITVAIGTLLMAAVVPVYTNLTASAQVNESTTQLTQTLRTAQSRAKARVDGSAHGLYIIQASSDSYVLYEGSSYASRDSGYDRVVSLDSGLDLTTTLIGNEINFAMGTGQPSVTGTITLTHAVKGAKTITLNEVGQVSEQ